MSLNPRSKVRTGPLQSPQEDTDPPEPPGATQQGGSKSSRWILCRLFFPFRSNSH